MSLYSSLFLISIYLWRLNKVTCESSVGLGLLLSPRLSPLTAPLSFHSHSVRRAAAAGEERAEVRREARRTEGRDERKAAGCDRGS